MDHGLQREQFFFRHDDIHAFGGNALNGVCSGKVEGSGIGSPERRLTITVPGRNNPARVKTDSGRHFSGNEQLSILRKESYALEKITGTFKDRSSTSALVSGKSREGKKAEAWDRKAHYQDHSFGEAEIHGSVAEESKKQELQGKNQDDAG